MRSSWGSELLRVGMVLSVPLAIAAVFPYPSLAFKARARDDSAPAFVAFVKLDGEAERNAIKAAKSTLRGETARLQRLRADLSFGELPAEPDEPVVARPGRRTGVVPQPVEFGAPAYRPSAAAARPLPIEGQGAAAEASAFPREELLKLD